MTALLKRERHRRIRQLIEENGRATVTELGAMFGVSEATIRRDLEALDRRGWIQREHGGALRTPPSVSEPPILQRVTEQDAEKQRIGRAAAQLVEAGETIFIGSGTTTIEVVRNLPDDKNLTIITNALNIAMEILNREGITLILIGGWLRPSEMSLIGHITEQALHELRADKVFLGMHAIDMEAGLTNDYLPEVMTDRAIIKIASEVILVADHTKFGRVSNSFVAPIDSLDSVVTDDMVPKEVIQALEQLGIRVMIV